MTDPHHDPLADAILAALADRPLTRDGLVTRFGANGPGLDDALRRLVASGAVEERHLMTHPPQELYALANRTS